MKEISIGEFARRSRLSLKALRLYDERGVLVPSRVDQGSGYRYYDTAQLEEARLVVMLRQLQLPLAAIKELLACDPADAATLIAEHWRHAEAAHDARRELAGYLVNWLSGEQYLSLMIEAGSKINWSALENGIVDRVFFYYGPKILGGLEALPLAGGIGRRRRSDAIRVHGITIHHIPPDEFAVEGYLDVHGDH